MYGSVSARMRAFAGISMFWGVAFCGMVWAILRESKEKRAGAFAPALPHALPAAAGQLLNGDLLSCRRGFFRQRQLEHAISEFRLCARVVDFLRQRKAAAHFAVQALGMQHALAFLGVFLALDFRRQGDLRAVDRELDVFLLHAR